MLLISSESVAVAIAALPKKSGYPFFKAFKDVAPPPFPAAGFLEFTAADLPGGEFSEEFVQFPFLLILIHQSFPIPQRISTPLRLGRPPRPSANEAAGIRPSAEVESTGHRRLPGTPGLLSWTTSRWSIGKAFPDSRSIHPPWKRVRRRPGVEGSPQPRH